MDVCVIGGGATGLIAAHYLKSLDFVNEVTLICPKDIPPIGVGESTTYGFFYFLKNITLEELDSSGYDWSIFYITTSGKDINWQVNNTNRPDQISFYKDKNLQNHYSYLNNLYSNQEEI